MERVVSLSIKAARDLDAAQRWFTQEGAGVRAAGKLESIRAAIRDLAVHPCRFPRDPRSGLRSRLASGYRLYYRVRPDTDDDSTAGSVRIMRIFAPYQNRAPL